MGSVSVFVMQMLMFVSCMHPVFSSQCCALHDLQFVIAVRGWKRQPSGRGILPEPVS